MLEAYPVVGLGSKRQSVPFNLWPAVPGSAYSLTPKFKPTKKKNEHKSKNERNNNKNPHRKCESRPKATSNVKPIGSTIHRALVAD